MGRTRVKFKKQKRRRADLINPLYQKVRFIFLLLLLLTIANFSWDGYERREEIGKVYKQGIEYYGIIVLEASDAISRIKNKINKENNKRK